MDGWMDGFWPATETMIDEDNDDDVRRTMCRMCMCMWEKSR